MQNIEQKKLETADKNLLAVLKDVDALLQKNEWDYKRTKFDLKDDKTLKITREGFNMFEIRELDEVVTSHKALWYIMNAFPSCIDITMTIYVN